MSQHDDFDGIQELDNPAPFWWQAIFYATIVFAGLYLTYFQWGEGKSLDQELAAELTALKNAQLVREAAQAIDPQKLLAMVKEPKALAAGKTVFQGKCVSCHAADGGGSVGPNLTDDAWIHGDGKPLAIYDVIKGGVTEKGMPPWGPMLSSDELMQVSAFVASLRGTHPAQPKPPQGNPQPI